VKDIPLVDKVRHAALLGKAGAKFCRKKANGGLGAGERERKEERVPLRAAVFCCDTTRILLTKESRQNLISFLMEGSETRRVYSIFF
jgi:hypothetical protein